MSDSSGDADSTCELDADETGESSADSAGEPGDDSAGESSVDSAGGSGAGAVSESEPGSPDEEPETAEPVGEEEEADRPEHLQDVADGCGCTEIWEHLSEEE